MMIIKKKAKEFREAVHHIFGYNFKPTREGVFRVQSIYSTRADIRL